VVEDELVAERGSARTALVVEAPAARRSSGVPVPVKTLFDYLGDNYALDEFRSLLIP
jgi:hypothetical protein